MEFTKIRITGPTDVDLPIQGADPAGPFILKYSDGLGPPEVDVFIKKTIYGGSYGGRRPQDREIVLRIGLQPDYAGSQTAEQLRTTLYGLLTPPPGLMLTFKIMNEDFVVAQTQGMVKRMEPSLFSKDPEVSVTISCPGSYFHAASEMFQTPRTFVDSGYTQLEVDNPGTAPSGFWIGVVLNSGHNGTLQLLDDTNIYGQSISINRTWNTGDRLIINTNPSNRGVWRMPAGGFTPFSILDDVTLDSDWMELHTGVNGLRINNADIGWYLTGFIHTPAYWGV